MCSLLRIRPLGHIGNEQWICCPIWKCKLDTWIVIRSGASHCRPNPMSNKLFRVADANSSAMVHRLAFSPPSRNPSSSCALIKQRRWCTIMQKRSGRAGVGGTRRRWMQRKSKSTPTWNYASVSIDCRQRVSDLVIRSFLLMGMSLFTSTWQIQHATAAVGLYEHLFYQSLACYTLRVWHLKVKQRKNTRRLAIRQITARILMVNVFSSVST